MEQWTIPISACLPRSLHRRPTTCVPASIQTCRSLVRAADGRLRLVHAALSVYLPAASAWAFDSLATEHVPIRRGERSSVVAGSRCLDCGP